MPHFEPYTPLLHTRVLAHSKDALLIIEKNTTIGIIDQHSTHICYLSQPSFRLGIRLVKSWGQDQFIVFRTHDGKITGFALGEDTELMCLLTTAPDKRPDIPTTTKLLATPQGLHRRANSSQDWITLLWLTP